ncbi:MAG: DUF488 domain-containing protein [Hyphomicrobiales bacterium]|nr:DUF488 domain-containing protein [Hyphomicrobiales bacterium]
MNHLSHPKLYSRQKTLLALLQKFGGKLSSIDLQKYLFLFTETCQKDRSYEFVPYRFGCFSFQSYADRRKFVEFGILDEGDKWSLLSTDVDYISTLSGSDQKKLDLFHKRFRSLRGNNLVHEIYKRFPYFAIHSEIAGDLMSKKELEEIEAKKPSQTEKAFFTIGYEGQTFENYLNRLIKNNVQVLCDVRKNPLSRKYGFSKRTLSETLEKLDIEYIHVPELGIVSDKRQQLNSQADYDRLFKEYEATTLKKNGEAVNQLMDIIGSKQRIAITCFEAEHCMCHRGRVAKAVSKHPDCDFPVFHI